MKSQKITFRSGKSKGQKTEDRKQKTENKKKKQKTEENKEESASASPDGELRRTKEVDKKC